MDAIRRLIKNEPPPPTSAEIAEQTHARAFLEALTASHLMSFDEEQARATYAGMTGRQKKDLSPGEQATVRVLIRSLDNEGRIRDLGNQFVLVPDSQAH
jgi:hypothetical protein